MKSIIQSKKECYVCHTTIGLHEHHIFFGKNRANSEKYGLKVYLSYEWHEGTNGVHGKNGSDFDLELKQVGQRAFMDYYNKDIDDFIKVFGRNYL